MSIRKHWKKICLSAATFFWTGCSDSDSAKPMEPNSNGECNDSTSLSPECGGGMIALYGVAPIIDSSSGAISSSDSCDENCENMISSSSTQQNAASSSSHENPFKLASDPTVSCDTSVTRQEFYDCPSSKSSNPCEDVRNALIMPDTLRDESVQRLEKELLNCNLDNYLAPAYGVPVCTHGTRTITKYVCDNGKIYSSNEMWLRDKTLYTSEEYKEKFPSSSSSSETPIESSSSEPPPVTCNHENILNYEQLFDVVKAEMYQELLQELDSDGNLLTADKRAVLESFLDRENEVLKVKTLTWDDTYLRDENGNHIPNGDMMFTTDGEKARIYNEIYFEGRVFKNTTCSDGTEEITALYKERADLIRNYIQGVIDEAWDGSVKD